MSTFALPERDDRVLPYRLNRTDTLDPGERSQGTGKETQGWCRRAALAVGEVAGCPRGSEGQSPRTLARDRLRLLPHAEHSRVQDSTHEVMSCTIASTSLTMRAGSRRAVPMRDASLPDYEGPVCARVGCGKPLVRRILPSGKLESAADFRRRTCCSPECRREVQRAGLGLPSRRSR